MHMQTLMSLTVFAPCTLKRKLVESASKQSNNLTCSAIGAGSQPKLMSLSCRLPLLDASVKAREDAAAFDTSRLVEFSERLLWEGPVLQLSPLVREPGRLAITDQRVYFQPLHNIAGEHAVLAPAVGTLAASCHVCMHETSSTVPMMCRRQSIHSTAKRAR